MESAATLSVCLDFCRAKGAERIYLCFYDAPTVPPVYDAPQDDVCLLQAGPPGTALIDHVGPLPVYHLSDISREQRSAVIVIDEKYLHWIMRWIEPVTYCNSFVVPLNPDWVVSQALKLLPASDAVWNSSFSAGYLGHSAMKGHYLEFGTFWGASFLPKYWNYHNILNGKFFGFDSFRGLSAADPLETALAPDFREGHYSCNAETFTAIAEYVGCDMNRIVAVPGYYADSLVGKTGADYGIDPRSVSVCVIDCDIKEPTRQALDFVLELLEPGALIYFDDWRLCRAHPEIGERGATLEWLKAHPEIDLLEFDRASWQHQWFIFNRRTRLPHIPDGRGSDAAADVAGDSIAIKPKDQQPSAPAPVASKARFAHVAEALRTDGIALCKDFFDSAGIQNIKEFWQTTKMQISDGSLSRSDIYVNLQSPGVDEFVGRLHMDPMLIELAQSYLGEDVCHYMTRLLLKDESAANNINCHQDWPYFVGDTKKISIMIPVTRHTEQNGKLYYIEKSHFLGPVARGTIDIDRFPQLRHVGPDLDVGDVFVHDWLTWHYSVPSQDLSDRGVIQLVYQPSSDPSSKTLVSGKLKNPFSCDAPDEPLLYLDPPWTVQLARSLWDTYPARASRICRGIIAQGDSSAISSYLLLAEKAIDEGEFTDAIKYLKQLEEDHDRWRASINSLVQRLLGLAPTLSGPNSGPSNPGS